MKIHRAASVVNTHFFSAMKSVLSTAFLGAMLSSGTLAGAAYPDLPSCTEEEELWARRVVDCWKDKEYGCAKSQIEEFFALYPQSHLVDYFCLLLGDIALQEKRFDESLQWYSKVSSAAFNHSARLKRWYVLYQQRRYSPLRQEIEVHLANGLQLEEEAQFYFAEACFREGLNCFENKKEESTALWQEALPYYQAIATSAGPYAQHAKLSIADICRLLGRPQEAAALYIEIAEIERLSETPQEEILLHVAQSLSLFDPSKAAAVLSTLCLHGKKCHKEAACHWFHLLIKMQDWKTLKANQDRFLTLLPVNQRAYCHLTLGKIALGQKEYHAALLHFQKSSEGPLQAEQQKNTFLLSLKCSQELGDLCSFERTYQQFVDIFGKDAKEIVSIELAHARLLGEHEQIDKALNILKTMSITEELCQEKIQLLLKANRFEEAYAVCSEFLKLHPEHPVFARHAIDLSLKKVSSSSTADSCLQLAKDIKHLLHYTTLSPTEEAKYHLLLAKAYYGCDLLSPCLTLLEDYLSHFNPTDEVHFLMALCFWKLGHSPHQLILHGEEALRLNPHLSDQATLRMALFNAYLELSKNTRDSEKAHQAAEHLYLGSKSLPIPVDKRLWLFHHYADYAKQNLSELEAKKAIELIEPLLNSRESWFQLEEETLQLAMLYELMDQRDQQVALLQKLSSLQASHAHLPWRHREKTELALANLSFAQQQWEEAGTCYAHLENSTHPAIASEARLQMARLLIQLLPAEGWKEDSPETRAILDRLQGLQLRKVLNQEPVHIEAAIELAEFYASLKTDEERDPTLLRLLFSVKEDFSPHEDIASKDYHAARELMPDKERIYQAYMRYLDAKIYSLQARLAKRAGNALEGKTKESAARALFSTLRQGKFAATRYLVDKAAKGMSYATP